jgi:prophage antirepressor-like protein
MGESMGEIIVDYEHNIWKSECVDIHFIEDEDAQIWFRAGDVAKVLGYSKLGKPAPGNMLRNVTRGEWKKKFCDIKQVLPTDTTLSYTEKETRYIAEPGFYECVFASEKPGAVAFKEWVCEKVIPALRRGYNDAVIVTAWEQRRVDSIAANASLTDKIKSLLETTQLNGAYAIVNDLVNRAVVGFRSTTTKFKQDRGIDKNLSIPDVCATIELENMAHAKMFLATALRNRMEHLQKMTAGDVRRWLDSTMRAYANMLETVQVNEGAQDRILPNNEAKRNKARLCDKRQHRKLLPTSELLNAGATCPPMLTSKGGAPARGGA